MSERTRWRPAYPDELEEPVGPRLHRRTWELLRSHLLELGGWLWIVMGIACVSYEWDVTVPIVCSTVHFVGSYVARRSPR